MSATVDLERRRAAHDEAIERGKAQLRVLQSVLRHFTDGLSARESADALNLSRRTVERYRAVLDLKRWTRGVERVAVAPGDSAHG